MAENLIWVSYPPHGKDSRQREGTLWYLDKNLRPDDQASILLPYTLSIKQRDFLTYFIITTTQNIVDNKEIKKGDKADLVFIYCLEAGIPVPLVSRSAVVAVKAAFPIINNSGSNYKSVRDFYINQIPQVL